MTFYLQKRIVLYLQKDHQQLQNDEQGHQPNDQCAAVGSKTATAQHAGQPVPGEGKHKQRGESDAQGRPMDVHQLTEEIDGEVDAATPLQRHAKQVFHLADDDQHGRSGNEAADHRPAQQLGEETEAQHSADQQYQTGEQRQHRGQDDVLGRTGDRQRAEHGIGHDRGNRHRPDSLDHAAAEHGIGNHRENTDVQASLRRQAGQQRIGETLRNDQDGDDQTRHQVSRQFRARIGDEPDGQKATQESHDQAEKPAGRQRPKYRGGRFSPSIGAGKSILNAGRPRAA